MGNMIDLEKETERVILVGVSVTDEDDTQKSLEELKDLASTAGADTVGVVIQNREQVHPGTYERLKRSMICCGNWKQPGLSVMMNYPRRR